MSLTIEFFSLRREGTGKWSENGDSEGGLALGTRNGRLALEDSDCGLCDVCVQAPPAPKQPPANVAVAVVAP